MSMETPERSFSPFVDDAAAFAVVDGFRARNLPVALWTHQAHLAVGLWHVRSLGEERARSALRTGIRTYNAAVGTPNSDTRGYHETVTFYFVWAAARFLALAPASDFAAAANGFVGHPLGSKSGIFRFWSRDRLLSVEARRNWVEPDLAPLAPFGSEVPMDAPAPRA
jgi:hypothetical protein